MAAAGRAPPVRHPSGQHHHHGRLREHVRRADGRFRRPAGGNHHYRDHPITSPVSDDPEVLHQGCDGRWCEGIMGT